MTVDERIEALTARHEALTMNVEHISPLSCGKSLAECKYVSRPNRQAKARVVGMPRPRRERSLRSRTMRERAAGTSIKKNGQPVRCRLPTEETFY
jgi:hypothetical protein